MAPSFEPDRKRRRPRPVAGRDNTSRPQSSTPDANPPSYAPSRSRRNPHRRHSSHPRSAPQQTSHNNGQQPPSYAPKARKPRTGGTSSAEAVQQFPQRKSIYSAAKPGRTPNRDYRQQPQHPQAQPRAVHPQPVYHQPQQPVRTPEQRAVPKGQRLRRSVALALALILVLIIGWPLYVVHKVNSDITRVDALSDRPATKGQTWLLAGSDKRSTDSPDKLDSERTDTIMMIHKAKNGQAVVISIPRDSAVDIPGYGVNKINAAFSLGGPPLLVKTVEANTGITIDHFALVTMDGLTDLVDAVDGVELCYDADVDDPDSQMVWKAGCHEVDGKDALAFARMRNADPLGDIGRNNRQRQVVQAVVDKATKPSTLVWPSNQLALGEAGARTISTDHKTGTIDLARMVFAYRKAASDELMGPPPISSLNYSDGIHGSMVLLDERLAPQFWIDVLEGHVTNDSFGQM